MADFDRWFPALVLSFVFLLTAVLHFAVVKSYEAVRFYVAPCGERYCIQVDTRFGHPLVFKTTASDDFTGLSEKAVILNKTIGYDKVPTEKEKVEDHDGSR